MSELYKGFVLTLWPGNWLVLAPHEFPLGSPCRVLASAATYAEAKEKAEKYPKPLFFVQVGTTVMEPER